MCKNHIRHEVIWAFVIWRRIAVTDCDMLRFLTNTLRIFLKEIKKKQKILTLWQLHPSTNPRTPLQFLPKPTGISCYTLDMYPSEHFYETYSSKSVNIKDLTNSWRWCDRNYANYLLAPRTENKKIQNNPPYLPGSHHGVAIWLLI